MAICVATVFVACITMFALKRANKKADKGERIIEELEGFRYTI